MKFIIDIMLNNCYPSEGVYAYYFYHGAATGKAQTGQSCLIGIVPTV
jgi:hypothetical protein